MKLRKACILALVWLLAVVLPASARKWTDNTGTFSIEAELVEVKDGKVLLKKTMDGSTVAVPVARLSEADREHLRSISEPNAGQSGKCDAPPLGKLSTLDRRGRPGKLKLAPDGVERLYIEGGTAAAAIWTFEGVSQDMLPKSVPGEPSDTGDLCVEMSFRAFRSPYRSTPAQAPASISVKNPKSGTQAEVWVGDLHRDAKSPICVAHLPRQIRVRRMGTPQTNLVLLRDFVADGSIEIIVRSLAPECFLGVREPDLRIVPSAKQLPVGDKQPEATIEGVAGTQTPSNGSEAPYARAIAACRGAWARYEEAIFEFTVDDTKRRGIFLEDEVRIANELHATLKSCLTDMQPTLSETNDGRAWFEAAIIHSLLGQDADAVGCFAKAAQLDKSYQGLYHLAHGAQYYKDGDLVKAYKELNEAVRLNPENANAYVMRAQVGKSLDMRSELDREKARQLDPGVDSPWRTLPWRTLHFLKGTLKELEKQMPSDGITN